MNSISLNLVVYNEEARLEACVRDARPWVDEVVIVDQSSTDATPELARSLADVYVVDAHHGYCEASREVAARHSSGHWILVLDADETMTDRFKREVRGLTLSGRDGYRLMREFYLDGKLEWRGDKHYRFFRSNRVRFLKEIHTEPQPVGANIEHLDYVCIVHTKSMQEQIDDELRYEKVILNSNLSLRLRSEKLALNVHLRDLRNSEA